jgi:hypothetical protein
MTESLATGEVENSAITARKIYKIIKPQKAV